MQIRLVAALGVAQTLAWASSYYLPAVVAYPLASDLNIAPTLVFAAFSLALIISAILGPYAGRAIDQFGGRPMLMASNIVFAVGLVALSCSHEVIHLFLAWAVIGLGMSCGLYEAAFTALVRLQGAHAKNSITGITLIAGFASTIGWPLTSLLEAHAGWRGACLCWAALHLTLGIALNASLPNTRHAAKEHSDKTSVTNEMPPGQRSGRTEALLAYVFAVTWFISTALAVHLPRLLQSMGLTAAAAVTVGALVGPAQIAGRILEFGVLSRWHPLIAARLAALMHPLGALALLPFGGFTAPLFALLHGAGNGILTIAQGTLPLALFGSHGYGRRQGLLMVPARFAQAAAPFLFGVCLHRWGMKTVLLSGGLGLSIFGALLLIRQQEEANEEIVSVA